MRRSLLSVFTLFFLSTAAVAETARPRVGLVLGGGGARGAAHIGVLETLEKYHVQIDCVAGTSMGALVAGAWAAGLRPAEMREALAKADWADMFIDNPEYSEMSPRNKIIARQYLPGSESGVSADGVRYQSSVVAGQKIKLFFNQMVRANQGERSIEDLPVPLAIVATDIGNGERVVFRQGALTTAMRASMAVPGLIAPVDHDGHKLVDGGLVDNLPVAEVRDLCKADVVIAVDVGSPLLKADEVGSLLTISAQMIGILTHQNVARSLAMLKPTDILIHPDLNGITAGDFSRHAEAADRGKKGAEQAAEKLAALGVAPEQFEAWQKHIAWHRQHSPRIDAIEIDGLMRVNPAAVERHLHVVAGNGLQPAAIDPDLLRTYGDGWYESVDYTVLSERGRNILRVMPVEKRWGPDYMRLGINLQADSSQGSTFGLRGALHQTWINPLGGEILWSGELGSTTKLGVDYYQPLDPAQRYFGQGIANASRERLNVYDNDRRLAQYLVTGVDLRAYAGYNVGLLGPIRAGWVERYRQYEPDIGSELLPRLETAWGGWQVRADFDQFDRLYFPRRGWSAEMSWFDSPEKGYARVDADLRAAWAVGDTVAKARLRYTGSPRGDLPIYDAGSLGGFQNLTAFATNQILGDDIRYASIGGERIIGRPPLGLRGDLRIGLTFEAAKAGSRYTETSRSGWIDSTAVYIGGETGFGPAYVGFGYSSSGVSNLFLFIGTP